MVEIKRPLKKSFVWNNRADRSANDLLQAGQIGAIIGSPRTRELIREAVAKSPADAAILVTAWYAFTAVLPPFYEPQLVAGYGTPDLNLRL